MEKLISAILIDDDILVREAWKIRAKKQGKEIAVFASPAEFRAVISSFSQNTPIYIDSNLAQGEKGELAAKEFFEQGFLTIFLATGYPASHFSSMAWIKGIVTKEPPLFG